MFDELDCRSSSSSLPTKCFGLAMTPLPGLPPSSPRTAAAPMTPLSTGSSPKYSGVRPDSGVRPEAMPGPRMTALPPSNASEPCMAALVSPRASLKVAAMAMGAGHAVVPALLWTPSAPLAYTTRGVHGS